MSLLPITETEYDVEIALAYATSENFTGRPIYRRARCYLHAAAAAALRRAVTLAAGQGYRLKIFDAFRPSEAQWVLWNYTPDPEFLADPRRGSPHSRGVAIDLTLASTRAGKELDMGTGFDAFTPLSHHGAVGFRRGAAQSLPPAAADERGGLGFLRQWSGGITSCSTPALSALQRFCFSRRADVALPAPRRRRGPKV